MYQRNSFPSRFLPIRCLFLTLALIIPQNGSAFASETAPTEALLGKQLFFEPRLSDGNRMSCSTCHVPELAFTDGRPLAIGNNGRTLKRNTPTLLNVHKLSALYWDGRESAVEPAILSEMGDPDAMNMQPDALVEKLNGIPGYVNRFQKTYGTVISTRAITRALAAFLRTLVTEPAPIDRYLVGDKRAISLTAQRGMELFQGKARCAFCHKGFDFTDSEFHNIGVPSVPEYGKTKFFGLRKIQPPLDDDTGRYAVTNRADHRSAFKTPTLRNITQTAPYMHNGVYTTLEQVMIFYNEGGVRNPNLDDEMKPLSLTPLEIQDVIDFMRTLTGQLPVIERPELP
jgi:cytochrome c peroxidase